MTSHLRFLALDVPQGTFHLSITGYFNCGMMTWTFYELIRLLKRAASSLESSPLAPHTEPTHRGNQVLIPKEKVPVLLLSEAVLEAVRLKLKLSVGKNYQGNDFADMTLTETSGRKQETEYPGEKENFSKTETS